MPETETSTIITPSSKKEFEVDYPKNSSHFAAIRYIFECGLRLNTNSTTLAIASTYYHKFFELCEVKDYDIYTIASTCIYIASKVTNDDIKVRDIINVSNNCLHPKAEPLSLDPYLTIRDSLMYTELLIMRVLGFQLTVELPHKYLLHYLNSLKDWLGEETFKNFPLVKTSWSLLQDSYYNPLSIKYSPQLLAVSAIYLSLQIYGVIVPGCDELNDKPWYCVLHTDCTTSAVWEVSSSIMKLYEQENELILIQ